MQSYLACLFAFLACGAFCFMFEVRKPLFILLCSLIGAAAWAVFLLMGSMGSEILRYFVATLVVSSLSELCARILKAPATIFLIIGIIPLVPGGGLYYCMESLINGDYATFAQKGLQTAAYAGTIAVGVSMVTSIVRMHGGKKPPAPLLPPRRLPEDGEAANGRE